MSETERLFVALVKNDWKQIDTWMSPLGRLYGYYRAPQGNRGCVIHLDDDELVSIDIGSATILNPRDMERLSKIILKDRERKNV